MNTYHIPLSELPKFIADSEDEASLDAMASAFKVVLNAAGPYAKYGSPVLHACVLQGTDHIDLSGEPLWMHEILGQYEELAKTSFSTKQ